MFWCSVRRKWRSRLPVSFFNILKWPHHLYWMLLLKRKLKQAFHKANGASWTFSSTGSLLGKDSSVMTRDSVATLRITWFQALEMLRASMVHGTPVSPAWLLSHHGHLASCKGHKDNLVFSWGGCEDLRDPLRLALRPSHDCYFAFWELASPALLHYLALCSSDSYFSATCSVSGLQEISLDPALFHPESSYCLSMLTYHHCACVVQGTNQRLWEMCFSFPQNFTFMWFWLLLWL